MTRLTNSAYCKLGDHFVPRGTTTSVRIGDAAFLVCPEHVPEAAAQVTTHSHYCPKCEQDVECVNGARCMFSSKSSVTCNPCAELAVPVTSVVEN